MLLAVGVMLAGAKSGANGQEVGIEVKPICVEKLTNAPGQTLTAVTVNYASVGKSVEHHHAGSVFAFVLTGAIRSENSETGPVKVYRAGESFFEPRGSKHLVCENANATEPSSMLAVFITNDGAQLTTFDADPSASSPQKTTPAELVDALNLVFGKQTYGRAVHAKGIVLEE